MGREARANELTWDQRRAQFASRADSAFASLRELFERSPNDVVKILGKIKDRKERCKVMLAIGMIDHIED